MLFMDEPYIYQGISYATTENFYQAMKLPKDRLDLRAEIAALGPYKAKTAIRDKKKYPWREDWNPDESLRVMDFILRVKFAPGTSWAQKLLDTGEEEIVEWNNWGDKFWGRDVETKGGDNHLGEMLMVIRSDLQSGHNVFPRPKSKIVHCQKHKFTKYIGRPKVGQPWGFGNPFVIGKDGDRGKVINRMKGWLDTGETYGNVDATPDRRQWILDNLHTLKGETIGCWCNYPEEDCHGRILLERAKKISTPGLKTIVAGSRGITDYNLICAAIKESGFEISEVVSGKAKGVDSLGERWAKENDTPIKDFPAKWDDLSHPDAVIKTNSSGRQYDALAGHRRNQEMADYAEALIAITNGSSGAADMIERAKKKGLTIFIKQVN